MHSFLQNTLLLAAPVALLPMVNAGFSSSAADNLAVYWGQNSYGQQSSQSRLSTYCANSPIDIIPVAFVTSLNSISVNFANAGDNCTTFSGTTLLSCSQIEEDIKTCQSTYGKTILISIGGATYTEGGFSSSSAAVTAANTLWATFGPVQSGSTVNRPFGTAVVDGFDFDFESTTSNMAPFAQQLRSLMDADTSKSFYLSAAPQCPYPDAADNDMLAGAVSFDFIMIQFYNNYCGVQSYVAGSSTQNNFNFETWDNWAKTVSKNPSVKVLMGIPGGSTGGSGYQSASTIATIISYVKQFSSFGGVMIWDMSQLVENPGFLDTVASALGSSSTTPITTTAKTTTTAVPTTLSTLTTKAPTTTTTTSTAPGTTLVPQWGQCGGNGYTGSTTCQSPYTCVALSEWWSQCE